MSDEFILCDICHKEICSGDFVLRGLKGECIEQDLSIGLYVDEEIWYHWDCLNQWKQVLDTTPFDLNEFNELGVETLEDGTIAHYFKRKEVT